MTKEMLFNNKYFNILMLFLNTSIIDVFFQGIGIYPRAISLLRLGCNGIFIIVLFYYFITRRIKDKRWLILISFLVLLAISLVWSIDKSYGFKIYINFLGGSCYFFLFCTIANKEKIMTSLYGYCNFMLLCEIVSLILKIGYMGENLDGAMSGIHGSRSSLNIYLSFAVCIYTIYIINYKNKFKELPKIPIFMIFICTVIMIASKSSTGVIILLLFPILLVIENKKKLMKVILNISVGVCLLLPFVNLNSPIVNNIVRILFNKTLTFSGRRYIWEYSIANIFDNKILGNGFQSTKKMLSGARISSYSSIPEHTHNGFLEVIVQSGILGAIILLIIVYIAYRTADKMNTKEFSVLKVYLIINIIFNVMEPFFLGYTSLCTFWLPIIYIFAMKFRSDRGEVKL